MEFLEACNRARMVCGQNKSKCQRCVFHDSEIVCKMARESKMNLVLANKKLNDLPAVTRQGKFLNQFPDALITEGVLDICPRNVDKDYHCIMTTLDDCDDCRREYWLKTVGFEEEKGVVLK